MKTMLTGTADNGIPAFRAKCSGVPLRWKIKTAAGKAKGYTEGMTYSSIPQLKLHIRGNSLLRYTINRECLDLCSSQKDQIRINVEGMGDLPPAVGLTGPERWKRRMRYSGLCCVDVKATSACCNLQSVLSGKGFSYGRLSVR